MVGNRGGANSGYEKACLPQNTTELLSLTCIANHDGNNLTGARSSVPAQKLQLLAEPRRGYKELVSTLGFISNHAQRCQGGGTTHFGTCGGKHVAPRTIPYPFNDGVRPGDKTTKRTQRLAECSNDQWRAFERNQPMNPLASFAKNTSCMSLVNDEH